MREHFEETFGSYDKLLGFILYRISLDKNTHIPSELENTLDSEIKEIFMNNNKHPNISEYCNEC